MMHLLLRFMGSSMKPVSGKQIVAYFNSLGYNYHQTGGVVGNALKKGHISVVGTTRLNGSKVNYFI